nr:retrovirus-related Pol polyprotein from transposon TNT 1-94 [Tanacetum cinerariifolium]
MEYASQMEIECAKVRGEFLTYKMESQKSFKKYTQTINDLNQTISEMKDKLSAHQETISILSQQKEAQIKLYKTRKDKELDKIIDLENKVKVLDNIVYKTGQSVQTMSMLNNKCGTSFAKPEFLKKAQRANPRLYDIGCYNDNLALMLAPESDEVIRLEKESRSKLSDLIRPFDYDKLNNLYDFFVPQREKSSEQRYFSERSRMSHISINNGNSKEAFNKQATLLEKRMDESIPWDKKCQSFIENFKVKMYVNTIFNGVELCKEKIAQRTYSGYLDPFIQNTIEANFSPEIRRINVGLAQFHKCLNEEMVADLRHFNSLKLEVDSLRSQLETQKTKFLNEIDRLSREYYYADHMNAILCVYNELDEVTNLKCDYLELLDKCECLETELSKSKMIKDFSKSKSVTQNNVSNDFSKPVTAHNLSPNKKSILKNTNVLAPGIYKLHTDHNQVRTSQLPQDSRKTNKRVSFSTGVIPTTSVSRPQLKSNPTVDIVMHNNSQGKKQDVEDHHRSVKFSKNKMSVTACNDSLNAKTLNVNYLVETFLFIVDSGCSKHMTRNLKLLINFVEKFLETVKFGIDQIAPILGYGDLKSTCYIRDLKGDDLLIGSRGTDLYSIKLQDTICPNPICLMAKASSSQAWLWHRRLSHLNFDTINLLSKNDIVIGLPKLKFIKDHLCSSIQIHHSSHGIFINQAKYAQEILKKHGMTSCYSVGTPMSTKHLDADLSGTLVDQTKYHSMIRALMYLTASRPDIMHATCYYARYQVKPTEKHLTAVKRIFWYLKDTIHMGLWYPKVTGFELTAFSDSDHAGCLDSCKSTSGGIQFLGGDNWSSKKQDCTSMSSAEAEYVFLSMCCAQVLWMRTQLTDYGFHFDKIPMYYDSKEDCTSMSSAEADPAFGTKHIDVRYHFINEKVEKGIVELFFVETEYQLADLFTKALPEEWFKYLVKRLGMRRLTPEELEALASESA